ncbi:MAG: DUF4349 domain-containing protein [Candidatus Shapirobacteria bacterium]
MGKITFWLKKNWQLTLIVALFALLLKKSSPSLPQYNTDLIGFESSKIGLSQSLEEASIGRGGLYPEAAPAPEVEDRLIVQSSWLSLLVKNVREQQKAVIAKSEGLGGYLVDSQLNSPLGVDSGSVTVRIPQNKLNEALESYRSLGVRVVSESLTGHDVTDQYIDIEARIATLEKTKAKFEEILNQATEVADILEVQRQIIYIQEQIDNLKGRADYLEKTAQNAKVTVYLSTDELSLPYAPAQPWRPAAIFKQATRSLIASLRSLGTLGIWLGVYAVVWLPLVLIIRFLKIKIKKK